MGLRAKERLNGVESKKAAEWGYKQMSGLMGLKANERLNGVESKRAAKWG